MFTDSTSIYLKTDPLFSPESLVNKVNDDYDWRNGCDDADFAPGGDPLPAACHAVESRDGGLGGGSSRLIKSNCDKAVEPDEHGFIGDPDRWDKYAELGSALAFKKYIRDHVDTSIWIFGHNKESKEPLTVHNNKVHRWCKSYVDARLAQLYKLKAWKDECPELPSNMWTFTVPHDYNKWGQKVRDGSNQFEAWENIRQGWDRLRQCSVMRKKSFVKFYEPHPKTGYPHIHLMCFDDYTEEEQNHIRELWHDFTGADLLDGSRYDPGKNPKSLIAYLMKYLSKQNFTDIDNWTDSDWLFNSIAHKNKYRLFSASADLSKIMELDPVESAGLFEWDLVKLTGLSKRSDDDPITTSKLSGSIPAGMVAGGKLLTDYPVVPRQKYPPVPVLSWGKIYGREIHDRFVKPSLNEF